MKKQSGLSLTGLLMACALTIFVAIFAFKVIPPYTENYAIKHILQQMASDPALLNASVGEIQESFTKHAATNDIQSVKAGDIVVSREGTGLGLSVQYGVKVPLFGNLSAFMDFDTKVGNVPLNSNYSDLQHKKDANEKKIGGE